MFLTAAACALGFANGMRHALEPDHLAAVSTLVAGERSAVASVRYAASWGAGHGVMLVVLGGVLAALRVDVPILASDGFELAVALVLIALGVRGFVQAHRLGRAGSISEHRHGRRQSHRHAGPPDHLHVTRWTVARLPFVVGLVHGLAGSGALAVVVAAQVTSPTLSFGFVILYALGAAVGMGTLAAILGWPLAHLARSRRAVPLVVGLSAAASLVVGIVWATPIVLRFVA